MATAALGSHVNAGPRLDRLPTSPLHRRVMRLVAVGMFFDGFDIYVAAAVAGVLLKSGFATFPQIGLFAALTFVGTMIGSIVTGYLGDRYGRRFTYQANLLVFGLASIAAAFAPNIWVLIALRFIMGIGLGAENVVGYSTMTEFAPARVRGRWLAIISTFVVLGLPVTALLSRVIIPNFGWQPMFVIGGIGALVVWYLRKALPESPRWLESVGRDQEAEKVVEAFEASAATVGTVPPAPAYVAPPTTAKMGFATLFTPAILPRTITACVTLLVINATVYGFITWIPSFFVKEGLSIATSFNFLFLMSLAAPIGTMVGAFTADSLGRKPTIIWSSIAAIVFGSIYPFVHDALLLTVVGFCLTIPIYVLVAVLFGVYIPELFPTEIRLRGSGFANMIGRGAAVVAQPTVVVLFGAYGMFGVLGLVVALMLLQIVVVARFGIEPAGRVLEEIDGSDLTLAAPSAHPIGV
jgi:putative MFS transporter